MDLESEDPEKDEKEAKKPNFMAYMAMSQFAYTLVIVTCLFGYAGHWFGTKVLGGSPWDVLLMIILGGLGMGLEMWRMIRKANSMLKANQEEEKKNKD